MTPPLLASAALGLVAAWPASGLGWLLGKAADRLTGDPAPRVRAWNRAVSLPPAVLAMMLCVSALPPETTAPAYRALLASRAAASAGAAVNEVSMRTAARFDGLELLGVLLIAGAVAGLALAAARALAGRARHKRLVEQARPADEPLTLAVRAAARRMDTSRPEVRVSDAVDQPMLVGLSTPVILLPAPLVRRLDVERLTLVCAHELAHLKRGDNWRLLVEHLLGGLFWMVPPFAAIRARAASVREELCDAMALEGAPPAARRRYAETLVEVLRIRAAPSLQPAFTGKGWALARLKAITDPRGPASRGRRALLGVAGLLAFAVTVSGSFALARQGEPGPNRARITIRSTDPNQNFTISADRVRVTNAELDGGHLTIKGGDTAVCHGHVLVRGRLGGDTVVLVNGRPSPPGFDPTKLAEGDIQALEVTQWFKDGKHLIELNAMTR